MGALIEKRGNVLVGVLAQGGDGLDWVCGVAEYTSKKGRWRLWGEEVDGQREGGKMVRERSLVGWKREFWGCGW